MSRRVVLLRGINVVGNSRLPMKELVAILESLGARDVRTWLQSGNAVFEASDRVAQALARRLPGAIEERRGFAPHTIVVDAAAVEKAMRGNPFREGEAEPSTLHLGFLDSVPPRPDRAALKALATETERFALKGRVFYLHAPDGIGRSKLAAAAERKIGVPMTMRNWRTVGKLRELLAG